MLDNDNKTIALFTTKLTSVAQKTLVKTKPVLTRTDLFGEFAIS